MACRTDARRLTLLLLGCSLLPAACGEEGHEAPQPLLGELRQALDPAPGMPDMKTESDTGSSNSDNITRQNQPIFAVAGLNGANIRFTFRYLDGQGQYQLDSSYTCKDGAPCDRDATAGNVAVQHGGSLVYDPDTGAEKLVNPFVDRTYTVVAAQDGAGGRDFGPDSASLGFVIDRVAAAPAIPVLQDASDTGRSQDDHLTSARSPTFNIGGVEAGAAVKLYLYPVTSPVPVIATGTVPAGWNQLPIQATNLADNTYSTVVAMQTDVAGNESAFSGSLAPALEIDTVVGKTTAPRLPTANDDTGELSTDGITKNTSPGIEVGGLAPEAEVTLTLICNANRALDRTFTRIAEAGQATLTVPAANLAECSYQVTARQKDLAGNESVVSDALTLKIDTTIIPPGQALLLAESDTGRSTSDHITKVTQPKLQVAGLEGDCRVTITYTAQKPANNATISAAVGVNVNSVTVTSPMLADDVYTIAVTQTDKAGNTSAATSGLQSAGGIEPTLTIDTARPAAPQAPDLQAASDSGWKNDDNLTRIDTPAFDVLGVESLAKVTVQLSPQEGNMVTKDGIVFEGSNSITLVSPNLAATSYAVKAIQEDLAGNISLASPLLNPRLTIDKSAPLAPAMPRLVAASDTGRLDTDNITNDNTPDVLVDSVESESVVTLFFVCPANAALSRSVSGTVAAGANTITLTAPPLLDAIYNLKAAQVDKAGNTSADSVTLSNPPLVIDTTIGIPARPDLVAASDTGRSSTDNLTRDTTPQFSVASVERQALVLLVFTPLDGGADASAELTLPGDGPALLEPPQELEEGVYEVVALQEDVAGNVSDPSLALEPLELDVTPPAAPARPKLQAASDLGRLNNDGITKQKSPIFDLTGLESEALVTLNLKSVSPRDVKVTGLVLPGANAVALDLSKTAPAVSLAEDTYDSVTAWQEDLAGNVSAVSLSMQPALVIDATAPGAPAMPDLVDASDTGRSDRDNVTKLNQPVFNVAAVEAGAFIRLNFDTNNAPNRREVTAVVPNGSNSVDITAVVLSDDTYTVKATQEDLAGNVSQVSPTLTGFVVDTRANPPQVPDLQTASDSGRSSTDNITAPRAPFFDLWFDLAGLESQARVTLLLDSLEAAPDLTQTKEVALGSSVLNGVNGIRFIEPADSMYAVKARQEDLAGNVSDWSDPLSLVVDGTPPAAPPMVDLQAAFDLGRSDTDNVTRVKSPTIDVRGLESRAIVTLYVGAATLTGTVAAGETALSLSPQNLADGTYAAIQAKQEDVAGNVSLLSPALAPALVIDTVLPAAPGMPDLEADSDTGRLLNDNVTRDSTPTLTIGNVEPNGLVTLTFDSAENAKDRDATGIVGGGVNSIQITPAQALADSTYSVTARQEDLAGNSSVNSSALVGLVVDTAIAPPLPPDLQAASDTGRSAEDNLTSKNILTFDVTGLETIARVTLLLQHQGGGDAVSITGDLAAGKITINLTTPALPDGTYTVTARQEDVAGNLSAASSPLDPALIVDTASPAPPGMPDLLAASDTGQSNTDNRTADVSPTFLVQGLEAGNELRLQFTGLDPKNNRELVVIDGSQNDEDGAANGAVRLTVSPDLPAETFKVAALQRDRSGNLSLAGPFLAPADPQHPLKDLTIDPTPPAVTPSAMTVDTVGASGFPAPYFIVGNQVRMLWYNNGGVGRDSNIAVPAIKLQDVWTVTMDFSNFAGAPRKAAARAVVAYDDGLNHNGCQDAAPDLIWTACYTIVEGDTEAASVPYTVTVTDLAGNIRSTQENEAGDLRPVDGVSPTVDLAAHGQFQYAEGDAITFRPDYTQGVSYAWSFGDGDISAQGTPVHAYRDQGNYAVSIQVTDAHGNQDHDSHAFSITNAAPQVVVVPDALAQEAVAKLFLVAKFTDPGVADDIVEAEIQWGDGKTDRLILPAQAAAQGQPGIYNAGANDPTGELRWNHTYANNGIFTVTVKVKDDDNAWSAAVAPLKVTVENVPPVIKSGPTMVGGSGPLTVGEGTRVQFQVAAEAYGSDDVGTLSYAWDFGETFFGVPQTSNEQQPFHTFDNNGIYPVKVTVTDVDGGQVAATLNITVTNVVPTVVAGSQQNPPAFEGDRTVDQNRTNVASFTVKVSDPSDADCEKLIIEWDMNTKADSNGDGNPGNDADVRIPALAAGVTCGQRIANKVDNVREHSITWVYDQDQALAVPFQDPYPIAVWVSDTDGGKSAPFTIGGRVDNRPPTVVGPADVQASEFDPAIGYDPNHAQQVCGQRIFSFTATANDEGLGDRQLGLRFIWNFGDGQTQEVAGQPGVLTSTVTHKYAANTGVYTNGQLTRHDPYQASVKVRDANGAEIAASFTVKVDEAPPKAVAQVRDAGPDALMGSEDDRFINTIYASEQNEVIYFTAVNSCDPSPAQDVKLTYLWEFGDGETAEIKPDDPEYLRKIRYVTHAYTNKKNYIVRLTVTDDDGQLSTADFEVKVGVLNADVRLTVDPSSRYPLGVPEGADNPAIEFVAQVMNQVPGETYRFVFRWNDGRPNTEVLVVATEEPLVVRTTHVYPNDPIGVPDGSYQLELQVTTGSGGSRSVFAKVKVTNVNPTVTAVADNANQLKEGVPVRFVATARDPGADTFLYAWDFNSPAADPVSCRFGQDTASPEAVNTYDDNGTYNVCVRVTDTSGGKGYAVFTVSPQNVAPRPAKPADILRVEEGKPFDVSGDGADVAGDVIAQYNWTVNSPLCRVVANAGRKVATLVCDDNGVFEGTLVVVDEDGGASSAQDPNGKFSITVENVAPQAKFCVSSPQQAPRLQGLRFTDIPSAVCVSDNVAFPEAYDRTFTAVGVDQGAVDNGLLTYTWLFGDGTERVTGQQVSHVFARKGSYVTQLEVADPNGAKTVVIIPVDVTNLPPAVNSLVIRTAADQRLVASPIHFHAEASDPAGDPVVYTWTFLQGGVAIGQEEGLELQDVFRVFGDAGIYSVRLVVSDGSGAQGTPKISEFEILDVPPTVEAGGDVVVREGEPVRFLQGSATCPGTDPRLVYRWDFGDGTLEPAWDADPTSLAHTYADEADPADPEHAGGCYWAVLTVKNKRNSSGSDQLCAQVQNVAPALPELIPDLEALEGDAITFATTAQDPGLLDDLTYTLVWGDATPNTILEVPAAERDGDIQVQHVYMHHGVYHARVDVEDDGLPVAGEDSRDFQVVVHNDPPTVVAESNPLLLTFYQGVENCLPVVVADQGAGAAHTCSTEEELPSGLTIRQPGEPQEGDPELGPTERLACRLCWSPTEAQIGLTVTVDLQVADDVPEDAAHQSYEIRIEVSDQDEDGCPDSFEALHECLEPEEEDCTDDQDGDRLQTLFEYQRKTDPCDSDLPTAPSVAAPAIDSEEETFTPRLLVNNSFDPNVGQIYPIVNGRDLNDLNPLRYQFEVGFDLATDQARVIATNAPVGFSPGGDLRVQCGALTEEGAGQTSWSVPLRQDGTPTLTEDTRYQWRVRACDGFGFSPWATGSFFLNTSQDPPTQPEALAPRDGIENERLPLTFQWTCSTDSDQDAVVYRIEFLDRDGALLSKKDNVEPCEAEETEKQWTAPEGLLSDDQWICWQVFAVDEHGLESQPSPPRCFLLNSQNQAPRAPTLVDPQPTAWPTGTDWLAGEDVTEVAVLRPTFKIRVPATPDDDSNTVTWVIDVDTDAGFASPAGVSSGAAEAQRLVIEPGAEATWTPPTDLEDNTLYRWRARGFDAVGPGASAEAAFFVNTSNDPCVVGLPLRPQAPDANPASMTPSLAGGAGTDPDHDPITYDFQVAIADTFAEESLIAESPVTGLSLAEGEEVSWTVDTALVNRQPHFWRFRCCDPGAGADERSCGDWSAPLQFVPNAPNQCPTGIKVVAPAADAVFQHDDLVELTVQNPRDPDFGTQLQIVFEVYVSETMTDDQRVAQVTVPLDEEGATSWTFDRKALETAQAEAAAELEEPPSLLLNQYLEHKLYWRARGADGEDNCLSEWTPSATFTSVGLPEPPPEDTGCCATAGHSPRPTAHFPLWLLVGLLLVRLQRKRR